MDTNKNSNPPVAPAYRYVVEVDNLGDVPLEIVVPLSDRQRQSLCASLDLQEVQNWDVNAQLSRNPDGEGVTLNVNIALDVIQSCVVTLDPVHTHVDHTFTNVYLPEAQLKALQDDLATEVIVDVNSDDLPDILTDAGVDVGEAVAVQLALIINPYPRKKGASLPEEINKDYAGNGGITNEAGPFAALGTLRSDN